MYIELYSEPLLVARILSPPPWLIWELTSFADRGSDPSPFCKEKQKQGIKSRTMPLFASKCNRLVLARAPLQSRLTPSWPPNPQVAKTNYRLTGSQRWPRKGSTWHMALAFASVYLPWKPLNCKTSYKIIIARQRSGHVTKDRQQQGFLFSVTGLGREGVVGRWRRMPEIIAVLVLAVAFAFGLAFVAAAVARALFCLQLPHAISHPRNQWQNECNAPWVFLFYPFF